MLYWKAPLHAFIVISCHLMDTIRRLIVFDICYDCPAADLCQTVKLLAMYGFLHLSKRSKSQGLMSIK